MFTQTKTLKVFLIIICLIVINSCSRSSNLSTEEYQYDKEGRLICRVTPNGSKIKYKYNNQGLPIEIDYPDDPVRYGYDANGNRIWMQNRSGKTEYKYDAFDRLTEVTFAKYKPEKRIRYEYDPWNRISSIKILDGQNVNYQVRYEYNIVGNLISIDDGNGRIEYTYHPEEGEVVRYLPNGIKTVFSYLPTGELSSLKHLDSQNRLISSYRNEYNPSGKISSVFEETVEGIKITKYEWDNRGYLKTLHLPDGNSIRYKYDPMGNRVSMTDSKGSVTYKYDNFGRLIKAGDIKYEWDDNGNVATQIDKYSKTRFRYDARNLPQVVKTPNETIHYKWDGDGNMISRGVGKDSNYYLPNPLAPSGITLAEFDSTGRLKSSYLYGDSLLGQRDSKGNMKYFLEDGFNSIRHIADANGKIIGQQDFTPFAEPTTMKGETADNFRMMGERFLPEIKKSLIGNRLYDPFSGRYLSPDPDPGYIGRFDSFNRYTHGDPDPNNFMEPRSNQTIKYENYIVKLSGTTATLEDYMQNYNYRPFPLLNLSIPSWPHLPNSTSSNSRDIGNRAVIVGGVGTTKTDIINSLPAGNQWNGVGTISTSISLPIVSLPMDLVRAMGNYLSGYAGPTGTRVINELKSGYADREMLIGHSNGSLTLWNERRYLADAIKKGELNFKEIYLTGVSPTIAHDMQKYFNKREVPVAVYALPLDDPMIRKDIAAQLMLRGKDILPIPIVGQHMAGAKKVWDLAAYGVSTVMPGEFLGTGAHELKRQLEAIQQGKFITLSPFPPGGGVFNNLLKSFETKLGGIKLDATAQFSGSLGKITGAVYDPEKQVLVVVGDENLSISIKAEDLAVALMSVYGPIPQDPQFTLDPDDPKNPRGKWLKAVYLPEEIIGGTEFGKTLFEADWLLKQYSFGVKFDENNKLQERKSSVQGFKSTAELSLEQKVKGYGKERWNRFWIVSDEMKLKQAGKSIYFDVAKMRVKSRKIVPDPNSRQGFRDVDTEDDPIATKFANIFTELYDRIANESPEFERVRQLAKAVAIAKWMKQEGVPIDTDWVNRYANKRIDTVGRITALSTQWEKKSQSPFQKGNQTGILTQIHKLYLFGGVDLTVNPKYTSDDGTAQSLQKAVLAKLREKVVEPTFDIKYKEKAYRAAILPVTKNGQELWKNQPVTAKNGTKYQFNTNKDIIRSTDTDGNIAEYAWDANHKLSEFKISANNGWSILGSRKNGFSEITVTNPRKHNFLYRYSPAGYLYDVSINGQRYASLDYKEGTLAINYSNFAERIKYDNSGKVKHYEVYPLRDGVPSAKPQFVDFGYDKEGNISEVFSPEVGHIKTTYLNGQIKTFAIQNGKIDYFYEAQSGMVTQINTSWGESARYDYDGDNLKHITYTNNDYRKDVVFEGNLPVEVKDNSGGLTKYKYTSNGFLEQITDQAGASGNYLYDDHNRIKTITLPNGSSINFRYEWQQSDGVKNAKLKRVVITNSASKNHPPVTKGESVKE